MQVIYSGDRMTASEMITHAIEDRGVYKKDVASKMGWSAANLTNKLRRNTITADEFIKLADILGFNVQMANKGIELPVKKKSSRIGTRIVATVGDEQFDNGSATQICHKTNSLTVDKELYLSNKNKFFIVTHTSDGITTIEKCTKGQARVLYTQCSEDEIVKDFPE